MYFDFAITLTVQPMTKISYPSISKPITKPLGHLVVPALPTWVIIWEYTFTIYPKENLINNLIRTIVIKIWSYVHFHINIPVFMEVTMFGRLQLYIVAGIFLFGALTAGYYSWRSGIEREALLEYNQKQLEQSIKDKEEMRKQLENIDAKQKEVQAENAAAKKVFSDKINSISADLDTKEVKDADNTSSKVLKDTVGKLRSIVK
jgi:uncharacterized membrane protein